MPDPWVVRNLYDAVGPTTMPDPWVARNLYGAVGATKMPDPWVARNLYGARGARKDVCILNMFYYSTCSLSFFRMLS